MSNASPVVLLNSFIKFKFFTNVRKKTFFASTLPIKFILCIGFPTEYIDFFNRLNFYVGNHSTLITEGNWTDRL